MASPSPDEISDPEGWEIANGHQQSPEPVVGPNCPDVVLKVQQLTGSGTSFLPCPLCLKGYKFLKNLGCQCNACMNCAERLLSQWRDGNEDQDDSGAYQKTRLCTTCDQEHTIPTLVHKTLKPVFGRGALKCMGCQSCKDTQDAWWCQDCSLILCSKCAHKKHRDHATVEFDQDYEAVRYCLGMFQVEAQETGTRFKTATWAKFEQIFKVIESAIDQELESQNKFRRTRLTDIFGHCPASGQFESGDTGYERIHRRLSVIQQRAKQNFPSVLDEILSLSGLGTKESIDLKTDVVAEKIVRLLKLAISELSVDDFKITNPSVETIEEAEPEPETASGPIMSVGELPAIIGESKHSKGRHY